MSQKTWFQIKALNNNAEIYIFDEIGYWGLRAKDFINELKEVGAKDIDLHLNSPGGNVFDGIAIYNMLKQHKGKVTVYIDGLAASMASVIAMAGDEVVMPDNALMMIHNPWGWAEGDADEMRKTADTLDRVKEALMSAYEEKSGIDRAELTAMLDAETWFTGAEAKELGFADSVVDSVELAATFDVSKLQNFKNSQTEKFKQSAFVGTNTTVGATTMSNNDTQVTNKPAAATGDTSTSVDVKNAVSKGIADFKAQEIKRKGDITTAFGVHAKAHPELMQACLADMDCTVDQARDKLLAKLGESTQPTSGGFNAAVNAGNGAVVKESMSAAIKARAGMKLEDGELSNDNPFRAMSMSDMARASLVEAGVGVASIGDRLALVAAAFTHSSSDFGTVLADVANKSMLNGYAEQEETFEQWTKRGSLSDFKTTHRVGINDFSSLRPIGENGEYKHLTINERGETIALATYGEMFSISRQAIINDDLGAFTKIPGLLGAAARRTIGDAVYEVLTANPKLSDNKALFHADHNNLSGSGSALSVDSLGAGRTAMRKQKLDKGKALNIRPEFLIVPAALETAATKLMRDTVLPGASNGESNPVSGMAKVISEARLDDNSALAWYLIASQMYDTIEVAYLDGNSNPFLDQMQGWSVDGTSFKVRIDAGVAPLDYRTMHKATGAA